MVEQEPRHLFKTPIGKDAIHVATRERAKGEPSRLQGIGRVERHRILLVPPTIWRPPPAKASRHLPAAKDRASVQIMSKPDRFIIDLTASCACGAIEVTVQ